MFMNNFFIYFMVNSQIVQAKQLKKRSELKERHIHAILYAKKHNKLN